MTSSVTIWYLEMRSPGALRAAPRRTDLEVREAEIPQFEVNRFLYEFVGAPWRWTDKRSWDESQWRAWADDRTLRTWIACHRGSIAGYYELQRQAGEQVEIAYFGLAPRFIGLGFGGDLLTRAIESAWAWEARRVWVHTCSLDHAAALANYEARGFVVYETQAVAGAAD